MSEDAMDWAPATPIPAFDPYGRGYMPGGWPPHSPAPPTAGTFAKRVSPTVIFSITKRVCTGLNNAFWATRNAARNMATEIKARTSSQIVQRVRREQRNRHTPSQQVRRARAPEVAMLPRRSQGLMQTSQGSQLLSDSPWHRITAAKSSHAPPTKSQPNPFLVSRNRNTKPELDSSMTYTERCLIKTTPSAKPSGKFLKVKKEQALNKANEPGMVTTLKVGSPFRAWTTPNAGSESIESRAPRRQRYLTKAAARRKAAQLQASAQCPPVEKRRKRKIENVTESEEGIRVVRADSNLTHDPETKVGQEEAIVKAHNGNVTEGPHAAEVRLNEIIKCLGGQSYLPTQEDKTSHQVNMKHEFTQQEHMADSGLDRENRVETVADTTTKNIENDASSVQLYEATVPQLVPTSEHEEHKQEHKQEPSVIKTDINILALPAITPAAPEPASPVPSLTSSEVFNEFIVWTPRRDKEYREMLRRDVGFSPTTFEAIPISGILSPQSKQLNEDLRAARAKLPEEAADKVIGTTNGYLVPVSAEVAAAKHAAIFAASIARAEGGSPVVDEPRKEPMTSEMKAEATDAQQVPKTPLPQMGSLTLDDRTPKSSAYRADRNSRKTRAEVRRAERDKELQQYHIAPLGEEWDQKVRTAVRSGHGSYAATDFARVVPEYALRRNQDNWLNDEVINGYLKMVADHGKKDDRKEQVPSHHAFNSFLYKNIQEKGPESVKRWAARAKIGGKNFMDTEMVFIPINQGMHWTLCVVEATKKTITVYNSLGTSRGDEVAQNILAWVRAEVGVTFNEAEWTLNGKGTSPQQCNSDDCGVFTITNARQIMLGKGTESYGSSDIPTQRKRIVAELVNGELIKGGT